MNYISSFCIYEFTFMGEVRKIFEKMNSKWTCSDSVLEYPNLSSGYILDLNTNFTIEGTGKSVISET